MTTRHLSETVIQQYALDRSACDDWAQEHVSICEHCKAKAGNYELMFSQMKEIPKPVFEFDLQGLVLENLQGPALTFSWIIFVTSVFSVACIVCAAYIFRDYLINIFNGVTMTLLCLIIVSSLIIIIFQSIEIFIKYQRKIDDLNFY